MENSIPIHRDTLKHWIYADSDYFKVWVTMLSRARYMPEPKTIIYEKALCTLNYGEFIFGYKAWSENTGIAYQKLRGLIKKLIDNEMLTLKTTTNRFTIYEVTNYSKFNSQSTQANQWFEVDSNSQATVRQQSGNSQATTNKESSNKDKKENNDSLSPKLKFTDEQMTLTVLLQSLIKDNNPNYVMRGDINKWANEIRLMVERDKIDIELIKKVIVWCQKDNFWKSNILSTAKLREKFNQLTSKMQYESKQTVIFNEQPKTKYIRE